MARKPQLKEGEKARVCAGERPLDRAGSDEDGEVRSPSSSGFFLLCAVSGSVRVGPATYLECMLLIPRSFPALPSRASKSFAFLIHVSPLLMSCL